MIAPKLKILIPILIEFNSQILLPNHILQEILGNVDVIFIWIQCLDDAS
jgi:hypothetical protein